MAGRRQRRAVTAEQAAAREGRAQATRIDQAAAVAGLPNAQRVGLALKPVPAIGRGPSPIKETVRKLTRVQALARSGALEPHEAAACDWFAERAALAWDTSGVTARYEGRSSGGGRHAPDPLMAKTEAVAWARDDYREAVALLPRAYRETFEAVVCRNALLGPAAAIAFPDLAKSRAAERLRDMVRFCANLIHQRFGALIGDGVAVSKPVPAPIAPEAGAAMLLERMAAAGAGGRDSGTPVLEQIRRRLATGAPVAELWMATSLFDALRRELGDPPAHRRAELFGVPIVLKPEWRWGWVPVAGDQ